MPHAFRLNLPSTGLQYSEKNVCLYKQNNRALPSVLAVSPEGCVRHWTEVGKPHKDWSIDLKNEVAHSVVVFDSKSGFLSFLL